MQYQYMAERMENIHSDIRGPVFFRALEMEAQGEKVLKLNTGNPATFGFKMPESIKNVIIKDFYETVGFEVTLDTEDEKRYILNIPEDYEVKNKVIDMEIV